MEGTPPVFRFRVEGSEPDPYEVTFVQHSPGNISVYCTCKAGQKGEHCKHRLQLIGADVTDLVSDNVDELDVVLSWISGSDIERALDEISAAERAVDAAKKVVSHTLLDRPKRPIVPDRA